MGRRIGKPQTPTKAGYSDVFNIRQHQKYVKDNILAKPEDDAIGGLRFDGTDYFTYTPLPTGSRRIFTISTWAKPTPGFISGTEYHTLISAHNGASRNNWYILPDSSKMYFEYYDNGTGTYPIDIASDATFRDVSGWYHLMLSVNTENAISTDRVKMYVNGEQLTVFSPANYPPQNTDLLISSNIVHVVGGHSTVTARNFTGFLSNWNFVDGLQLDPTYFGYIDRETSQWKPKKYTGDFGVTGYHAPMENSDAGWNLDTTATYNFHTIVGATNVYDEDYGGRVLNFDGTNDYVRMQDDAKDPITNSSFTIAAWVNIKSGTGYGSVDTNDNIIKFIGTPNAYINIQIDQTDTSKVQFRVIESDSSGDIELYYTYTLNEWFHFAYVGDVDEKN